MTKQELRRWLKATIAELNRLEAYPDLPFHVFEEAAEVVRQAGRHAALLGYAAVARRCADCTTDALALSTARAELAACVAAVDCKAEKPDALNAAQVAKTLAVRKQKVLDWIRSGELRASNVGSGYQPRWRITRADLDVFLAGRNPTPRPSKRKRQRQDTGYTRYYPES